LAGRPDLVHDRPSAAEASPAGSVRPVPAQVRDLDVPMTADGGLMPVAVEMPAAQAALPMAVEATGSAART
jgi:hypothetical protein